MHTIELPTNTSQWSLVFHKVTATSVELWAGTLFGTLRKPKLARLVVSLNDKEVHREDISLKQWQRPFNRMSQRFYDSRLVTGLQAGLGYKVDFYQRLEGEEHQGLDQWQLLRSGTFSTLPIALSSNKNHAFTVALSSCFYEHRDSGQAARAFKALYERGAESVKPDIKFMVGDQVYLDIGLDSLSPLTNEVRQRVAEDYAKHWQALGSMLARGGAWMLPDDHEFWNDYPFYDGLLPTLFMLKIRKIRNAWKGASRDGVLNVQQSSKVDIFEIGSDLSFCVADLRSYRSKTQFIDNQGFEQMITWAEELTKPGVLVIPQVLLAEKNKLERNLLSFKKQYSQLITAMASTGHDIVVMSGDVHFGRIAQVKMGENGGQLIEVVSSPMSNLTGLNSLASDKAKKTPKQFPDPNEIKIPNIEPQTVQYDKNFNVLTKKGFPLSAYWRERTREHFMTVSFHKNAKSVGMSVQAWRIRQQDKNRLPVEDFKQAFSIKLK
ncbi:hypothetical protein [uncultured Paraglaciecola sp.]|uniref:hypothetical protein n=1 Tax=uncultured Paraglaciecola sp. TaxID=1765024 RepID=UPI00261C090F|nr:hypothetical protein [uncultured Paraglaciecola sp.]